MKFYFVRHGQSQANVEQRYQSRSVPLSPIGRRQAALVARRFDNLPVDVILASSCRRTVETTAVIRRRVAAPVHYTYLLEELRNPRALEGRRYNDPEAYRIKQELDRHRFDETWHYDDEENLADLLARAELFCALALGRREEHILVVTHGAILKMILTVMIFGDEATPRLYHRFDQSFDVDNTGLTWCEYTPDQRWLVHAWNDSEHLGQPRTERMWTDRN